MGAELNQKLFSAADNLRGKMSADQYKDYLLGLIFYKYLSDKLLESTVVKAYKSLDEYNTVAKQTELYKSYILNDKNNIILWHAIISSRLFQCPDEGQSRY